MTMQFHLAEINTVVNSLNFNTEKKKKKENKKILKLTEYIKNNLHKEVFKPKCSINQCYQLNYFIEKISTIKRNIIR